jgi:putative aminopeptidase FrvX
MDPLSLLQELVSIPGPPGQEGQVRDAIARHIERMGRACMTDAKGNLIVGAERPDIVVTAHMDEIAMMVRGIENDGEIAVGPLGGLYPWKLGEGPVTILPLSEGDPVEGVLSFGGIHSEDGSSVVENAEKGSLTWEMARVLTGLDAGLLWDRGVRPGSRVVVSPSRRELTRLGDLVAGYFLDDRADLVSWLLALEPAVLERVAFVATAAEEVGGEGALYYLQSCRPKVCIALELGPNVPDAPVEITADPTLWVTDSYSTPLASDLALVESVADSLGMGLQFQALSRGGSDASCAASHGLCARPFTLGLPMENSHGYEIIHPDSMEALARLTVGLLERL